jgi:BACON domain-containing protein
MKRILSLASVFTGLLLATSPLVAAFTFTPGNIVIYRVGDGTQPLTNGGNSIFLDEYMTNGTYVQSLPMPTSFFGGYYPLISDGQTVAEGAISRSQDGRFLVLMGYGAPLGFLTNGAISSSASVLIPRVIATVDGSGHINSTTALTNSLSDAESPRSAASTDGTNLWTIGDGAGDNSPTVGGIRYLTRGSSVVTQVFSTVTNFRQLNIYDNQLYFSDASGTAFRLGTSTNQPLPTDASALYENLPGFYTNTNSPFGFAFFNLNGGPNADTLYVADNSVGYPGEGDGVVWKYSLNGGTWVNTGSLGAGNCYGLAGIQNGSQVTLFITSGGTATPSADGYLYIGVDSSGYNGDPGPGNDLYGSRIDLSTKGIGLAFGTFNVRGVAIAPQGSEVFPSGPGQLSVGPINGFFETDLTCGPFNDPQAFYLANPGTTPITWSASVDSNWVSVVPSSGSLSSGGSATVTASFNGFADNLVAGTNFCNITFQNVTSSTGTTTQQVRLILLAQTLTPSDGLAASGAPGGPFSPSSIVYTLSNGCGTVSWIATNTQSWLSISPRSGTLNQNQGATITVSLNANANSLAAGPYSDTITFSNVTGNSVIATRAASLNSGFTFIFDDFSTYSSGALLGQNGWQQNAAGTSNSFTITVANGQAVIPGGKTATGQWLYKNFPTTTNPATYAGMLMTVTSVGSTNANYANNFFQFNNGTLSTPAGFALYELSARSPDTGLTNFVFAPRTSQQGNTPYTNGATSFPVGTPIRVIVGTDVGGTNTTVYINPTGTNPALLTPYVIAGFTNGFTADPGVGSFGLRVNGFGSVASLSGPTAGEAISKLAVSTNFADVYNWISAGPFVITSITRSGNNVALVWNTQSGTNVVQVSKGSGVSGNYATNNFTDLFTNIVSTVGTATFTDVGGATNKPARYYRIDLRK